MGAVASPSTEGLGRKPVEARSRVEHGRPGRHRSGRGGSAAVGQGRGQAWRDRGGAAVAGRGSPGYRRGQAGQGRGRGGSARSTWQR
jgi:hypothetical protein